MDEPAERVKNGVNLSSIEQLVGAIQENADLARVQFRARSRWQGGTQAAVTIGPLIAGGADIAPPGRSFEMTVDEPGVLGGKDEHPNPVEYLATALCGCITAGIATNAALFDVSLDGIEVDVDVNFDIRGVLGLDRGQPNGPLDLHYRVRLSGDSAPEYLRRAKETIDRKSPIRNTIELPLRITTELELADS